MPPTLAPDVTRGVAAQFRAVGLGCLVTVTLVAACQAPPPPAQSVADAPPPEQHSALPPSLRPKVVRGVQRYRGVFEGGAAAMTVMTARDGTSTFLLTGRGRGCSYQARGTAPSTAMEVVLGRYALTRQGRGWAFAEGTPPQQPNCTFRGEVEPVRR